MTYTKASIRIEAFVRKVRDADGAYWMAAIDNPGEIYKVGPIDNTMVTGLPVTPCDSNYQPIGQSVMMLPETLLRGYKDIPSPSELMDYMRASRKLLAAQVREAQALKGDRRRANRINGMICPSGFRPADRDLAQPVAVIQVPATVAYGTTITISVGNYIRLHVVKDEILEGESPTQYERLGAEICSVMDRLSNLTFAVSQDVDDPCRLHFYQVGSVRSLVIPKIEISFSTPQKG